MIECVLVEMSRADCIFRDAPVPTALEGALWKGECLGRGVLLYGCRATTGLLVTAGGGLHVKGYAPTLNLQSGGLGAGPQLGCGAEPRGAKF